MAQRRRRRSSRSKQKQAYPGWLWMMFGLSLGLSVAFAVYVKDRQPDEPAPKDVPQAASPQNVLDDNGENAADESAATEPAEKRFTFWRVWGSSGFMTPWTSWSWNRRQATRIWTRTVSFEASSTWSAMQLTPAMTTVPG